ncbi:unnamed protein product [Amoebophrya sp. A25]|nr:unnamed protein product [Amoebophrya sp. A25]|eukprot:GSA25T00024246001.1
MSSSSTSSKNDSTELEQARNTTNEPLSIPRLLHGLRNFKVQVAFRPIAMAPKLKDPVYRIDGTLRFAQLYKRVKQALSGSRGGIPNLYMYLQNSFQPEGDDCVADLYNCFKGPGDQLVFTYSLEPAYS